MPAAFVRTNFTGTVDPALHTLRSTPCWCAAALIGCRTPRPYTTLIDTEDAAGLPALSLTVAVAVWLSSLGQPEAHSPRTTRPDPTGIAALQVDVGTLAPTTNV